MFENFDHRGREVVARAQEQSRQLGHHYVGTEHLLLGILGEQAGPAVEVLSAFGVTAEAFRRHVRALVGEGQGQASGMVPVTPRVREILLRANRIRLSLGSPAVAPEHLCVAIVDDDDGVAVLVLGETFGVARGELRDELVRAITRRTEA